MHIANNTKGDLELSYGESLLSEQPDHIKVLKSGEELKTKENVNFLAIVEAENE